MSENTVDTLRIEIEADAKKAAKEIKAFAKTLQSLDSGKIEFGFSGLDSVVTNLSKVTVAAKHAVAQIQKLNKEYMQLAKLHERIAEAKAASANLRKSGEEAKKAANSYSELVVEGKTLEDIVEHAANPKGVRELAEESKKAAINVSEVGRALQEATNWQEAYNTAVAHGVSEGTAVQLANRHFSTSEPAKKTAKSALTPNYAGQAQNIVQTSSQVDILKKKIDGLYGKLAKALEVGASQDSIASYISQIQRLEGELRELETSSSGAKKSAKEISSAFKDLANSAKGFAKLGIAKAANSLRNSFSGLNKQLNYFGAAIKNVIVYSAISRTFGAINTGVKTGTNNLYQYSKIISGEFAASMDRLASSLQYFQNSIGAAVAPLINSFAPAIELAVDKVVELINSVNQLFAKLTGASSWTKAVKVQKEYAEAADDAASANKNLLAGFDELNVIQSQSGGPSASAADYSTMFEEVPLDSYTLPDFVQTIKDKIEEGDWKGVGQTLGEKVNGIVENTDFYALGQGLGEKIANALEVATSFFDTVNFSDIGAGIAEFFNGIFAEVDFTKLGELFAQQFTSLVEMIYGFITTFDWAEFIRSIGEFISGFFSELGESFDMSGLESLGESIKKVFDGIAERLAPFAEIITTQIAPAFKETLNAALEALAAVIDNVLRPAFEWLWDNAFQPLAEWASTNIIVPALDSLRDVFQKIADVLNGELSFNEFIDGLSPIQALALAVATAVVTVTTAFTAASAAIKVATTVVSGVKAAIALLSSPIGIAVAAVTALIGVGVLLYQNWDTVKSTAISVWTYIKDFFGEVGRVIKQDIDSVVERFTNFGNSVKQVFEDLWDRLKVIINFVIGGIETMTNGVIRGINKMTSALNKLSFDIPDWVPGIGGESFGFSIPSIPEVSIPRLASGGVVTGPTIAQIGEYPGAASNPEIVAPQKIIYDTVVSANSRQEQLLREQNTLLRQLLQKESTVTVAPSASWGRMNAKSNQLYEAAKGAY